MISVLEMYRGSTVVVTSPGGDEGAAIRLGQEIHRRNLKVVVRDYCLGACAAYVMGSGTSTVVAPATLVAFMPNAVGVWPHIEQMSSEHRTPVEHMRRTRQEGLDLLSELDLDPQLLLDATEMSALLCLEFVSLPGGGEGFQYLSAASAWVPSRAHMEKLGWHISGYWPENSVEVGLLMARYMGPGRLGRFGEVPTDYQFKPRPCRDIGRMRRIGPGDTSPR